MQETILIVEDDNDINNLLAEILRQNGYSTVQAYSGTEGEMRLESGDFSLMLLDLMLPGLTGEELIQKLRSKKDLPILVVSAKTDMESKVEVLRLGADDYITKPFHTEELLARVEAHLRRSRRDSASAEPSKSCTYKDITVDPDSRQAHVGGEALVLTSREFDILELLMSSPKKVFTKANIYRSVWNDEFYGDDNTVNVHISNLRSKLGKLGAEEDYIQTVWGIGFKMCDIKE